MDLFCNLTNQTFVRDFRGTIEPYIAFAQGNDQTLRLYLLRDSRHPGSSHPFIYDALSGAAGVQAIVSLCDITGDPVTLASTLPLGLVQNGFAGFLNTSTQEIIDFLAGRSEKQAALRVDLTDADGHVTTPFRRSVTLRATDTGTVTSTAPPGVYYLPLITGYTGGGATNADGIVSIGRAQGSIFMFVVNGSLSQWRLEAGTLPTDVDAGIIQLLDSGLDLVRVEGL